MPARSGAILGLVFAVAATGCVDRRFVVRTNVPGAQIYRDGTSIGPAPVDASYVYAGWYEFRAVAPGYEPLVERVRLKPRWYDYPGLDLIAEVLYPGRIEDVREVNLALSPAKPVKTDELIQKADARRQQGNNLPPSSIPDKKPER